MLSTSSVRWRDEHFASTKPVVFLGFVVIPWFPSYVAPNFEDQLVITNSMNIYHQP